MSGTHIGDAPGVGEGGVAGERKLGLAFSGGGFRAAIFHLGVLARLAEVGVLRQVEVLSTVSGGSIVGAFYYLHARRLLESEPLDSMAPAVVDQKYVELVEVVVKEFRAAVQKNARARLLLNPFKNVRMAIPGFRFQYLRLNFGIPYYSRTDRIGDLLDRFLYKKAFGQPIAKRRWFPLVDEQIKLRDIKIEPKGGPADFNPEKDNRTRGTAKVPIILINASSLNTGHNWRFEAVGMGEPLPQDPLMLGVFNDVQGNQLLAQGYFDRAPQIAPHQRDFPLAKAVAASAAFPGIFHPLSVTGMYRGWRPELVDGGLHDNQGVQGLSDKSCTHMIISDASGQLGDITKPETRIPSVAMRSIDVYGARVREEELARAEERKQWTAPPGQTDVRGVVIVHLRKGLTPKLIPPLDQSLPLRQGDTSNTDFGVDPELQRELAEVRTDEDVFSDAEFYSLMYDGYTQTDRYVSSDPAFQRFLTTPIAPRNTARWGPELAKVEQLMKTGAARPALYDRTLKASKQRLFRALPTLLPATALTVLRVLVLGLALAAAIAASIHWRHEIGDGLRHHWPIWWTALGIGGPLVIVLLYVQPTSFPPLRVASSIIIALVGLALAVPATLLSLLMMLETPILLRLGRVR